MLHGLSSNVTFEIVASAVLILCRQQLAEPSSETVLQKHQRSWESSAEVRFAVRESVAPYLHSQIA